MGLLELQIKRVIDVPTYFNRYINRSIDLNTTSKICCPFHEEDTPSFTYSAELGKWRCWGACKHGGDVIELHRFKNKIKSREEAEESLAKLLGIKLEVSKEALTSTKLTLNYANIEYLKYYNEALKKAKAIEDYKALDRIMSEFKDIESLTNDLREYVGGAR